MGMLEHPLSQKMHPSLAEAPQNLQVYRKKYLVQEKNIQRACHCLISSKQELYEAFNGSMHPLDITVTQYA